MIDSNDIDLLDKLFTAKLGIVSEKLSGLSSHINAEFINIHERMDKQDSCLEEIEAQTKKTNGRVTDLEKAGIQHIITCPQIEKIKELDKKIDEKKGDTEEKIALIHEDLSEYKMVKKYPKIGLAVIIISCVVLFILGYTAWSKFSKEIKTELKMEISNTNNK